ncbi:MAG: PcfB family protein [Butyrivibrio sp.]|nr:PcfB family protein [Butyrivibrio sp.]
MQEEVEQKTINLAVNVSKLSWRVIVGAVRAYINHKRNKQIMGPKRYRGKQTVKQLISQDQGATSMLVGDEGIKDFQRIAKRYGVDFAITKDKFADPPKYTVFFKAKDLEALEAVMNEFEQGKAFKKERPSVLHQLEIYKEKAKEQAVKAKIRVKEMVR